MINKTTALSTGSLIQGDCIEGMKAQPSGSVDFVFADPPFNINYSYDTYKDNKSAVQYLAWSAEWLSQVYRILKPTGTFWLAIGDEYAAELKIAAQSTGFTCRSWVIWYYTFGVNCVNNFTRSHTHLLYFVKDAKQFTFNADDRSVRVPSARQLIYNDSRQNPAGRLPDNTWILRPQDVPPPGLDGSEDTWVESRVCGTFKQRQGFHGCQMPERVLARIVQACSLPGELVLDPFAGSGTTLVVAKKLGRRYLGFELSADYARQATERIAAAQTGQPIEGGGTPYAAKGKKGGKIGEKSRESRKGTSLF